jgi:GNAT superfamily N-acetyltransferase
MNRSDALPFTIRNAEPGDEGLICGLLAEFAAYERLADEFHLTPELARRDLLLPGAVAACNLAFVGEEPAGITVWFWTYRSFGARRGLFVEDLFVRPRFRGQGLGKALLAHLARIACEGREGRMDWLVLHWNKPAQEFYHDLGARPVGDWIGYRIEGDALTKLAS